MLSSCMTGSRSNGADKHYGSKRLSSNGFNQYHHQSRLELLASSSSDNLDNGPSGNSSDHSCRSLLSGQHLTASKLTITDNNNNNNNVVAPNCFINADGSIFALAGANQAPLILRHSSFDSNVMLEQVSSSSSSSPALPRANNCQQSAQQQQQQKNQQRRLQYQPIHQKLQRIYGNKVQEFEHQKQNQLLGRQQPSAAEPQGKQTAAMAKNQSHQQAQSASHHHHHHEHAHQKQFPLMQPVMHHHHHHAHDHQEQTYDSLTPPAQHRKQHHHHFVVHSHQQIKGRPNICAIPEEECDLNNNEILVQDDDERDELFELVDEETSVQDEQVTRPVENQAGKVRRPIKPALVNSSSVLVDNRKKHLESLHYATATAAALLNVTANAAAAFAASEKHLNRHLNLDQQQRLPPPIRQNQQPELHHKPTNKQQIYSETYQDINHNQPQYKAHQQYQPVMHYGRPVVEHPVRAAAIQPTHLAKNAQSRSISFRNQQLRQQQRQIYNQQNSAMLQPRSQPPNQVAQRQAQLPRKMQVAPLTAQQVEMLRQQRQLQQKSQAQLRPTNPIIGAPQQLAPSALALPPGAAGPPTLALLHQPEKFELEVMSRLLNQQQNRAKQRNLIQYPANLDPRFLAAQHALAQVASSKLQAANRMQSLGNHDNKQQVTYGLLVAPRNKQLPQQQQQQQIYGGFMGHSVGPLLQKQPHLNMTHLASGASSEASGHTNLPLILDRRLRPVGFVEKICQIDLTLFWWTLLIICVIFIATVVTITRYVF